MTIALDADALVSSHTKEVASVTMVILTNVLRTMNDTSNKRGLPSKSAMSLLRLSGLALNRSRW